MSKRADIDVATATMGRDAPVAPLGAVVRISGVEAPPEPYTLDVGRCVIGSSQGADLIVTAPTVSRRHVELSLVPEGVMVKDLGSRNGTFYMGQRVEKITVSLGTTLELGKVTLRIDADDDALDSASYEEGEYCGIVGASAVMRGGSP